MPKQQKYILDTVKSAPSCGTYMMRLVYLARYGDALWAMREQAMQFASKVFNDPALARVRPMAQYLAQMRRFKAHTHQNHALDNEGVEATVLHTPEKLTGDMAKLQAYALQAAVVDGAVAHALQQTLLEAKVESAQTLEATAQAMDQLLFAAAKRWAQTVDAIAKAYGEKALRKAFVVLDLSGEDMALHVCPTAASVGNRVVCHLEACRHQGQDVIARRSANA